jgi:rRNA maturation endonuclease Nob1
MGSGCAAATPGGPARRIGKEDRMLRILCLNCLKLWPGEQVAERVSCPHCGGPLEDGTR